jgi:hypothetical protein
VDEIAASSGTRIRAAVISGEMSKDYLIGRLRDGARVPRLFPTPRLSEFLTEDLVTEAERIQCQMGVEPIREALKLYEAGEVDGVLTGRALDLGVHMAYPLTLGTPLATAAHVAKVVECGGFCCDPPNPFTAVIADVHPDGMITVEPALDELRCSAKSLASHALYERENPSIERNPGGNLDLSETQYEQVSDRLVRTYGAHWWSTDDYYVKLEGVRRLGFETTLIAVVHDGNLLAVLDDFVSSVTTSVGADVERSHGLPPDQWSVAVHALGGHPNGSVPNGESRALLVRSVAPSQELSTSIANTIRVRLNQGNYRDRRTTAGNLALPFAQGFLKLGACYVYNIWHLLPLDDPLEPFPIKVVEFPRQPATIEAPAAR